MDSFFGIKPEHAVAGVSGALAYLPFVKRLTHWLAIVIPFVGFLTAIYMTPVLVSLMHRFYGLDLNLQEQSGLAFGIGFSAMVLILPMVLKAINKVQTVVGGQMIDLTVEPSEEFLHSDPKRPVDKESK